MMLILGGGQGSYRRPAAAAPLDRARVGVTGITMPTITFKVTPAEARELRARARAERATLSAYVRAKALPEEPRPRKGKLVIKRHPVSGLLYDATPGPMVSQAEIDAALADFP